MQVSARKMKRTKREQLLAVENMNADSINRIFSFAQQIGAQTIEFQKEILAMKRALIRKGLITELEVAQERTIIEEVKEMESKAIIIGGK